MSRRLRGSWRAWDGARCRWAALVMLAAASCAHPGVPDPTETFLDRLIAGDRDALVAGFAGEPSVDDPMAGRVRGLDAFQQYVRARRAWLTLRAARVESLRTTRDDAHTVVEALLHLRLPRDTTVDLPVAIVGDRAAGGRVSAIRIYHSHWPLTGRHQIRAPLLPADTTLQLHDVIADYQKALASGDVDAILNTFEPDGYFREPSGGIWVHRGRAQLREFMQGLLAHGGIGLEHCTLTDDGVVAAIEFNAVRFGTRPLRPQAGLAVYERGAGGKLRAARIYDDVNVEVLAGSSPPRP